MTIPNTPKYHPDLEVNVNSSEKKLQNPETVQQKISEISKNIDSQNPEIQEKILEILRKVTVFNENNYPIPTAITNILATIEKHQKPTAIAENTLKEILAA